MNPIAVIDFETTGLSPAMGDRATEIAIVVLED
jgi:DNA polymerase-3 subunit epsilon